MLVITALARLLPGSVGGNLHFFLLFHVVSFHTVQFKLQAEIVVVLHWDSEVTLLQVQHQRKLNCILSVLTIYFVYSLFKFSWNLNVFLFRPPEHERIIIFP